MPHTTATPFAASRTWLGSPTSASETTATPAAATPTTTGRGEREQRPGAGRELLLADGSSWLMGSSVLDIVTPSSVSPPEPGARLEGRGRRQSSLRPGRRRR